ncbi:MAG TPA: cell division topological specificity factor MinE [Thermodesulfovibrionia bacterium]|nr:cell division topological specificity factor MinE [Thermodesulfovibrionia bacterium]
MFKGLLKNIGLSSYEDKNSKEVAKERLKLVLMHERAQLTPDQFARMKDEIMEVIKKYLEIDAKDMDIKVQSDSQSTAFILNAKIVKVK